MLNIGEKKYLKWSIEILKSGGVVLQYSEWTTFTIELTQGLNDISALKSENLHSWPINLTDTDQFSNIQDVPERFKLYVLCFRLDISI